MEKIPHMVSMEIEQPKDGDMPVATNLSIPARYPYGLGLCLNDPELKKLGLDEEDCEVGDHVHFHCLAKVTSCSDSEGAGQRIELQIVAMSAEEHDEEDENEEGDELDEVPHHAKLSADKMYGK